MDIIHQIIESNQGFTITIAEIVVFTVFISLILYHLLIYLGRKDFSEGKLYLNFSLLLTGFLTYIFLDTNLYFISAGLVMNTGVWTTFFTGISWSVIFYAFHRILYQLLPEHESVHKQIRTGWIFYTSSLVLWLMLVVPSFTKYNQEVFRTMWYVTGLFIFFQVVQYIRIYLRHKRIDSEVKLIFWGVLGYVIYMWIYRLFLMNYPGKMELWIINNILKIIISFTFALALARKFNREFADLVTLKENLEQKVNEKTKELQIAKDKIENESRLRTEYFIQVAHETKTPLTLIGNYLHRLEKINGTSTELQVVQHNFKLLRDTMIMFLDSEKLEKGQIVYSHAHTMNLSDFIAKKNPLYTNWASDNNLVFRADIGNNVHIQCDPLAMERILNNLVDNAIKYTTEGEVQLTLKTEQSNAVLNIQDSGPGIPADQQQYVFERYYRGSSTENTKGGLGMGLYIVKKTVDSLKGKVSIHSQQGRGTTFTVRIPLSDSVADISSETINPVPIRNIPKTFFDANRKNILLVEDNRDMSAYLVSELNETYNVFYASNGSEALDLLKSSPAVDLIVSDVMMSNMNGYEFFETLSQHPVYKRTPLIFITARSNHQEKIEYLNRGVVDYIFKPFSIDELLAKINSILKQSDNLRKEGLNQAIQAITQYMEVPAGISPDKWRIFETRVREYELTERQQEVIREVEKGSDYRQIAENLHVSQKTIHRHMQILFEKFEVHNKIDLLKKLFE